MWGDSGKQWHTTGDKGRRGDKKGDNGRQLGGQWETMGDTGRHGETRRQEGGHTIQHKHTYLGRQWKTMKNKTSGRWTIQNRHMWGDNGKKLETMEDNGNGKHVETTGDKDRQEGRQGETRPRKADTLSKTGTHVGTMGDNSETRRREGGHTIWGDHGKQWELRLQEGGHTIQPTQVHTCGETMGENGKQWGTKGGKTSGRRRHHPTQAHMWVDNAWDKTSGRRTHHPTQTHMCGDNGRQDVRKADATSNTDTHVGTRQRGKSGDKVPGRRTRRANQQKGNTKGDIGWETKGDKTKADTLRMR